MVQNREEIHFLDAYFQKDVLVPAVVQEAGSG